MLPAIGTCHCLIPFVVIKTTQMKGMDSLHSTGHRETPRKADVFDLDSIIRNSYSATEMPSDVYDQSAMTRKEGVYQ